MSTLHAYLLLLHAKNEREQLRQERDQLARRVEDLERQVTMTTKMQGLAKRMAQFKHDGEDRADKLTARMNAVEARHAAADSKMHQYVAGCEAEVADMEKLVSDIDAEAQSNGGPPLDSAGSPAPAAS